MKDKLVLVYDLDQTMLYSNPDNEIEWVGGKDEWLNLSLELMQLAKDYDIEMNFAIASTGNSIDGYVEEAVKALKPVLKTVNTISKEIYSVANKHEFLCWNQNNMYYSSLFNGHDSKCDDNSIVSSVHINRNKLKSESLKKIAEMFEITDNSNVILVDDVWMVRSDALRNGFSVISSEGVCVKDEVKQSAKLQSLFDLIRQTVEEKMQSLKEMNLKKSSSPSMTSAVTLGFTKSESEGYESDENGEKSIREEIIYNPR